MIKVRVYFHELDCGEQSICFESREFGWLEYYDNSNSIRYKNKAEMLSESYVGGMDSFYKYGKLTYLGEL